MYSGKLSPLGTQQPPVVTVVPMYPSPASQTAAKGKEPILRDYYKSVAISCAWVVLPMVAFTSVIIWMIFKHQIALTSCPHEELCLSATELNNTASEGSGNYIVDFPAARLVFIASWSSTISFALTGVLMTMYGSSLARDWLRTSQSEQNLGACPTPYQASVILRLLNAEMVVLCHLAWDTLRSTFWRAEEAKEHGIRQKSKSPRVMRAAIIAFVVAIFASALVQVSDTYLHIATDAIELTELHFEDHKNYAYSQNLESGCINRERESVQQAEFWGCGVNVSKTGDQIRIQSPSAGDSRAIRMGLQDVVTRSFDIPGSTSGKDTIALLVPKSPPANVDWKATTFGMSTQCYAVSNASCTIGAPQNVSSVSAALSTPRLFSCKDQAPDFFSEGIFLPTFPQYQFLDFHHYIDIPTYFQSDQILSKEALDALLKLSLNFSHGESERIFKNPWKWVTLVQYTTSAQDSRPTNDTRIWKVFSDDTYPFMVMSCNTTVWDVTYSMANHKLTSFTKTLSNSTTTGSVSMFASGLISYDNTAVLDAEEESEFFGIDKTVEDRVEIQSTAINRAFLSQLLTEARPVLKAQTRASRIVTKVPKAAVWALITSNLLFALLAIVFAGLAVVAASPQVQQLELRLNITGLAAQIFEGRFAKNEVKKIEHLFEERNGDSNRMVKRVYVEETEQKGAAYVLLENWESSSRRASLHSDYSVSE